MFIKEAEIKRLFKEAYKGVGLRIANDGEGLMFTGRAWKMYFFRENFPKEIMGAAITLTGEIPEPRNQILYNAEGAQTELFGTEPSLYKQALEAQAEGSIVDASCDIMIRGMLDRTYRILKDDDDREYAILERFAALPEPGLCDNNENYHGCYAAEDRWLYWLSDYMAYAFPSYVTEDEIKGRARELKEAGII